MSNNACGAKTHNPKARSFSAANQVLANIYSLTSYKHDFAKATQTTTGEA
jgi:hypothetical protein